MLSTRFEFELISKYAEKVQLLRHKTCPLSRKPIVDPVYYYAEDDRQLVFSRANITAWIQKHEACPITGKRMTLDNLRVYHTISLIEKHLAGVNLLSPNGDLLHDELLQEDRLIKAKQFAIRRFITEIKFGDVQALQEMFGDNIRDYVNLVYDNRSALDYAITTDNARMVNILVQHGANISFKSCGHTTPLNRAISRKQEVIVKLLLAVGAEITEQDLITAAWNEESNTMLDLLLDKYISINKASPSTSLLNNLLQIVVRKFESPDMIHQLIGLGANPNSKDANGDTPLHIAVKTKYNESNVQALCIGGALKKILNSNNLTAEQTISKADYYYCAFIASETILKLATRTEEDKYSVIFTNTALFTKIDKSSIPCMTANTICLDISDAKYYNFILFNTGSKVSGSIPAGALSNLISGYIFELENLSQHDGNRDPKIYDDFDESLKTLRASVIYYALSYVVRTYDPVGLRDDLALARNNFCSCNINKKDIYGQTLLFAAVEARNYTACLDLLSANADPLLVDNYGNNIIIYASRASHPLHYKIMSLLFDSIIKHLALALDKKFIIKGSTSDEIAREISQYDQTYNQAGLFKIIISLIEHKVPYFYINSILHFDGERIKEAIYSHINRSCATPLERIKLCETVLDDHHHPFHVILSQAIKSSSIFKDTEALQKVVLLMEETLSSNPHLFAQLESKYIESYNNILKRAARDNDSIKLRGLFKLGINVNICDDKSNNCTPLMAAVMRGNYDIVHELLAKGACHTTPVRGTKAELLDLFKKALPLFSVLEMTKLNIYLSKRNMEIIEITPEIYCTIIGNAKMKKILQCHALLLKKDAPEFTEEESEELTLPKPPTSSLSFVMFPQNSQISTPDNDKIFDDEFTTCHL